MSTPAAYLGVIVIWSTTPLAIKWSAEDVGFMFGLTARMLIGVSICLLLLKILRLDLPWRKDAFLTYLAAGLGLFLAMTSVYWASQYIPSGWISVVFGTTPLVTGMMASYWLGEKAFTWNRLSGMLLGLAGLALVFSGSQALGADAVFGIAGVLLSVLVHSVSSVTVKGIGAGLSAVSTTAGGLLVATPLYVLTFIALDAQIPQQIPVRAAMAIGYLGVVGSVLGFVLYFYVLRRVSATRVALIALLTPVIALILGSVLNAEPVQPVVWSGAVVILSGLVLFEYGDWCGRKLQAVVAAKR